MAVPNRQQCEHCGASVISTSAYLEHVAQHEPGGKLNDTQTAPGTETQTDAARAARKALLAGEQTPGEAERRHDEARRG